MLVAQVGVQGQGDRKWPKGPKGLGAPKLGTCVPMRLRAPSTVPATSHKGRGGQFIPGKGQLRGSGQWGPIPGSFWGGPGCSLGS